MNPVKNNDNAHSYMATFCQHGMQNLVHIVQLPEKNEHVTVP
jgi:hypothetical protein